MEERSVFEVYDIVAIKLLTRLKLGFNFINYHNCNIILNIQEIHTICAKKVVSQRCTSLCVASTIHRRKRDSLKSLIIQSKLKTFINRI